MSKNLIYVMILKKFLYWQKSIVMSKPLFVQSHMDILEEQKSTLMLANRKVSFNMGIVHNGVFVLKGVCVLMDWMVHQRYNKVATHCSLLPQPSFVPGQKVEGWETSSVYSCVVASRNLEHVPFQFSFGTPALAEYDILCKHLVHMH